MKSDTRRKVAGAMAALSIGAAGLHAQGKDVPKLPSKVRELTADELNAWDKANKKEKETLMPNDIIVVLYTNNKAVKYTKVALDKKGNIPLNKAVERLFTARGKA